MREPSFLVESFLVTTVLRRSVTLAVWSVVAVTQ